MTYREDFTLPAELVERVKVFLRSRLLSDNGPCYLPGDPNGIQSNLPDFSTFKWYQIREVYSKSLSGNK
jgi:hypothetical protein